MASLLGKLRIQIQDGFKRRNKQYIRSIFDSRKNGKIITTSSLRDALRDLNIIVAEKEFDGLLKAFDMNDDGGLEFDAFLLLVNSLVSPSSPGLEFLRSLPLAELVFDGLPKEVVCAGEDSLRKLCNINPNELEVSIQGITEGLIKMLHESLAELKKSFDLLDSKVAANNSAAKKFEITNMSVGSIQNFHAGIPARIGGSQFCDYVVCEC
jgi:hypothetical protein